MGPRMKIMDGVERVGTEARLAPRCSRPGRELVFSCASPRWFPLLPLLRVSFDSNSLLVASAAMVSSEDIAEEIRNSLPGTEEIIVQYLSGYLLDLDDAAEDEDVLQVTSDILDSAVGSSSSQKMRGDLDKLVARLAELLKEPLTRREEKNRAGRGTGLVRLDKVMDLSKTNVMSSTIAFTEGVDLESINKGK